MKFKPIKFRGAFDYDVEEVSNETAISFSGVESLTVQSMAEDADINVLMDRYGITGRMPENPRLPEFGDFTGVTDYQSALNAVIQASDDFMALPARVRARFNNNPQELLAFVSDDANIEEAQKLGLLKEKVNGGSGSSPAGAGVKGPVDASGRPAANGVQESGGGSPGGSAPGGGGAGSGTGAAR